MIGKILKAAGVLATLLVVGVVGFLGYCSWNVSSRKFAAPLPDIKADSSPEALARGAQVFTMMCGDCHINRTTGKATGRWMDDVPAPLGHFETANLTHDEEFGIGKLSDGMIARVIRTGIHHDGTVNIFPMPHFTDLSDADIAAVLGYLRSDAPVLAADKAHLARPKLSVVPGLIIQTFVVPPNPEAASKHIEAPKKAATVDYGRYAANAVYQCWDCHTEGFSPSKRDGLDVYGGGFELADPAGAQIFASNITFSKEGVDGWTLEQFARAVREGIRPDGYLVRSPMPKWRAIDDTEMAAIYAYLLTVPPSHKATKPGKAVKVKAPPPDMHPDAQFVALGCSTCHAKGAAYHEKIKACAGKPVDEVAAWIRNPEKTKPNTQMPTFADLITEEQAKALAAWVQENPARAD